MANLAQDARRAPHRSGPRRELPEDPPFEAPRKPRTSQRSYIDDVTRADEDEARANGASEEQVAHMHDPNPWDGDEQHTAPEREDRRTFPFGGNKESALSKAVAKGQKSKRAGTIASGALALVAYAVAENFLQGGWAQVKGWLGAKFLNKPYTAAATGAAGPAGPLGPNASTGSPALTSQTVAA